MTKPIFAREGRGVCKKCARELDIVMHCAQFGSGLIRDTDRPVVALHLARIEEITMNGVKPEGFCPGSLGEADPVKTPARVRGKGR